MSRRLGKMFTLPNAFKACWAERRCPTYEAAQGETRQSIASWGLWKMKTVWRKQLIYGKKLQAGNAVEMLDVAGKARKLMNFTDSGDKGVFDPDVLSLACGDELLGTLCLKWTYMRNEDGHDATAEERILFTPGSTNRALNQISCYARNS